MDKDIPFTPPPYYVPVKDLPRRRQAEEQPTETPNFGQSSMSRKFSISRRGSSRTSNDGRVQKTTKKKPPGLSIDTTVTRHKGKPPQELKNQPVQLQQTNGAASSFQPWQATQQVIYQANGQSFTVPTTQSNDLPAQNSPSRFPATYIDASKRETLRPSPGYKDMYFAPPPGSQSRRTSSVYSRTTRASSFKEDSSRRRSLKQKLFNGSSTKRGSSATAFEEDISQANRNRITSGGTVFEEDGVNTLGPESTYTITPHRSRGWWNLITTPFEAKPGMALDYRSPSDDGRTPAVPSIPKEFVNPLSSPARRELARNKSNTSGFSGFSPNDREIPIMLDGNITRSNTDATTIRQRNLSPSTAGSVVNRMPFADMGKTPPSGLDEFSPAGMVSGEGNVRGAATVVNINIAAGVQQGQSGEFLSVENGTVIQSKRTSFREAVSRTVRFISPHNSGIEAAPNVRNISNDPPQTPKQVRFANYGFDKEFSPPPVASKGTSIDYEEFEIDDKPLHQKKKKKQSSFMSFLLGGKKLGKKNGKHDDDPKKDKKKMSRRRKCCFCCLCFLLTGLVILILIIVLAVTMSKKHKGSGTQVVWTNITNFPPIPSGALTVARANLVSNVSACVVPLTVWSCAVPKEQQASISPNAPTQPNFLIDIVYDNSTTAPPTTLPPLFIELSVPQIPPPPVALLPP